MNLYFLQINQITNTPAKIKLNKNPNQQSNPTKKNRGE